MRYTTVTKEVLESLRTALTLLEQINDDPLEIFLYGLTKNAGLIAKAEDALEQLHDEEEGDLPKLDQIAICIPLGDDIIYYLLGSGLTVRDEEFAYIAGKDNVRTSQLTHSRFQARVTDEDFSEMAIASSDSWLDDFLSKHGRATASQEPVTRDEPATAPKEEETTPPPTTNPIDNFLST